MAASKQIQIYFVFVFQNFFPNQLISVQALWKSLRRFSFLLKSGSYKWKYRKYNEDPVKTNARPVETTQLMCNSNKKMGFSKDGTIVAKRVTTT